MGKSIEPLNFDVSGDDGATGPTGMSVNQFPPSLGQHGRDGQNGTEGQRGASGGTIAVRLSTPKWIATLNSYSDGEVKSDDYVSDHSISTTANIAIDRVLANPIDMEINLDGSIGGRKLDTLMVINAKESLSFVSLGGNGGNGGNGGHGQDGGNGFRYGAFLTFNESIAEHAWRTVE
jgi:hypothetical protein